ncbi:MAG: translation initiation factor IF-2 [Euryarchaeota archaeon]|nr:translation initiation factor IF-2 [Euryarchaeota archaeon]
MTPLRRRHLVSHGGGSRVTIRQPIVSVLGHVDHGKTSLLDKIRGGTVAAREAGQITQHIGATEVPLDTIREICGPLMAGKEFKVPGLLFIDTPGHQAFTSLRARGGALADIAILVVDINEGLMPQTREAINILRRNKTPFVIAANKIDRLLGWTPVPDSPIMKSLSGQPQRVKDLLDEKTYELIGKLSEMGLSSDRYDRVADFTKAFAIIPLSARTGEGVPDLLLVLVGLAQRFLEKQLETELGAKARGTVLEVKEERGLGTTLDVIIYDGTLSASDTIVIGGLQAPIVTKTKALLKPAPLDEIRDPRERFKTAKTVAAASGVKISAPNLEGAIAGGPLYACDEADVAQFVAMVERESTVSMELADDGIFLRADTLGSLEAIGFELKQKQIPVKSAAVGDVSRRAVVDAATVRDQTKRAILAFNVKVLPDAETEKEKTGVAVFASDVIYHLIDEYAAWVEKKKQELEAESRGEITYPGKIRILPNHTFRVSRPAIVGVRVLAGRVKAGQTLIRDDGKDIGKIKSLRSGEETVKEAKQGEELAVAIDDATVGRQINEEDILYVDLHEGEAKALRKVELTFDEQETLDQVCEIKRKSERAFWGM